MFLIKQLFHSRLLDMRLVIADSALRTSLAIYHLISNALTEFLLIITRFTTPSFNFSETISFLQSLFGLDFFNLKTEFPLNMKKIAYRDMCLGEGCCTWSNPSASISLV